MSYLAQLTIYPCGLVALWIEHCTGIARSWIQIPFKPEFFQVAFSTALVDSTLQISVMFIRSSNTCMIVIYSHSYSQNQEAFHAPSH